MSAVSPRTVCSLRTPSTTALSSQASASASWPSWACVLAALKAASGLCPVRAERSTDEGAGGGGGGKGGTAAGGLQTGGWGMGQAGAGQASQLMSGPPPLDAGLALDVAIGTSHSERPGPHA